MATPNRASILTKAHKVLKKHYSPVTPASGRTVLETMLYACCLENAPHDKADDVFARLQESYFDWNEVRVTTITELAEVMSDLPDPMTAAGGLKRALQGAFETEYSFDMEGLIKENIGKAVKKLEKYSASPFVVAYVTQNALGGHAIPVDRAALDLLLVLGVISETEPAKGQPPRSESAIPKGQGVEFGSLLHQLAVDFRASPMGTNPRKVIMEIEPEAKERLPKRASPKKKKAASSKSKSAKKSSKKTAKTATPKKTAAKKTTAKKTVKKKAKVARKKSTTKRLIRKKPR